ATVRAVAPGSSAAKDGMMVGDEILGLNGQPILSIADIQWILHRSRTEPDQLKAEIKRGGASRSLTLSLAKGWRRQGDFSWRACNNIISPLPEGSHDLSADEKKALGLSPTAVAIRIQWKNRGFQKDDIIVEVDGERNAMTISDFIAYTVQNKKPKEKIALTVLRAGKEHKMQVEAREAPIE
ncbi:MAG: PDZ domain-containing protein, partial [Verrucomicrobiales bacterium]|nr:PDZ domain-containing protein [Verrucomicrobiales bacterium]